MSWRVPALTAMIVTSLIAAGPRSSEAQSPAASAGGDRPSDQPQPAQPAPEVQPAPKPPLTRGPEPVNVRVDITITDQSGAEKPVVKTLTLVQSTAAQGLIRTRNVVAAPPPTRPSSIPAFGPSYENLPLNVDAMPTLLESGKVRLRLKIDYQTLGPAREKGPRTSSVTEDLTMILDSGKPLVVSQSADAASDRKVTVEVKATVMR